MATDAEKVAGAVVVTRSIDLSTDQLASMLGKEGLEVPATAVPKVKYETLEDGTTKYRITLSWPEAK